MYKNEIQKGHIMKKTLSVILLAVTILTGSALAQIYGTGETLRGIGDTVTTTNGVTVYLGFAKATTAYSTPSTNAAVWKIIRTTYDTNGNWTATMNAYNTTQQGTNALWSNTWTNRVNATYK